ncbi:hypothetical protein V8B97DRAFT_654122 [Scleroderma yunnanense]
MPYCDRCDRDFRSYHAYEQHIDNSARHNICDDCDIDFASWTGLKEHWVQSPRHSYCQYCDCHFDDGSSLLDHYRDEHYYCEKCNRVFKNEYGLHEHNRQSHYYCESCKRVFQSPSNLSAHMNSSTHRSKDVPCPFNGCDQSFVSKSALILHLESGGCKSGVNRQMVNRYVREVDRTNIITNPSRLLTGGDNTDVSYTATDASWNGRAYECVLCHNLFRSLRDLNRHLASPRHQSKVYRCPLDTCQVQFSTLSALCQHIESEKCGVSRFKVVKHTMDNMLSGVTRIGYY